MGVDYRHFTAHNTAHNTEYGGEWVDFTVQRIKNLDFANRVLRVLNEN